MTSHDRLYDTFEQFLQRCLSMTEAESMDRLIQLDLSMSQARAVFVLAQAGDPMPIHQLAERLRLSVAAAGRTVDQLVQAGLVDREESPVDRRVKLVTITKAGVDVTDEHIETKRASMRTALGQLTVEQADRLTEALTPLLDLAPPLACASPRPTDQEIPA